MNNKLKLNLKIEPLNTINKQEKFTVVFKAVIFTFIISLIAVTFVACEKNAHITEVKTTTINLPETTATPKTVAETTTTFKATITTIETGPIEYEGVTINPIEELRFDNGIFFAQEGNPYGLDSGTKAGVFIIDAFEMNGQMENSIGLRPEVIEVLQQKYLEENKELKIPIPFNLEKNKGVVMELLENKYANDNEKLKNYKLDNYTFLALKVNQEAIIYSPIETKITNEKNGCLIGNYVQDNKETHDFLFRPTIENEIFYKGKEIIHKIELKIFAQGSELLIPKQKLINNKQTETNVGMPLIKIFKDPDPNLDFYFQWGNSGKTGFSLNILCRLVKYKEIDGQYQIERELETGKDIFLEINQTKISIIPNT